MMTSQNGNQPDMPGPATRTADSANPTEAGPGQPAKPPVIEGPGRYVVYQGPESWKIARAVGICDRCAGCGCGEQAEPVDIPDFSKGRNAVLQWAMKNANGGLLGNLRAVMGRG